MLGLILDSVFSEKQAVDFSTLNHFMDENYFELTGVAINPLTGFDGKLTTKVMGKISSFLPIDDVQL